MARTEIQVERVLADADPVSRMSAPLAIARFEVWRSLRDPATTLAALLLLAFLTVGNWSVLISGGAAPEGSRLFAVGYLAALTAGVRLRLGADRRLFFHHLLRDNFVTAGTRVFGKLLALGISLIAFGGFALVAGFVVSRGEAHYALWYSLLFTLVALLSSPAVVLVELIADTRIPVAVVVLLFAVASVLASRAGVLSSLLEILGLLGIRQYRYTTLLPVVWRVLLAVPMLHLLLHPLWLWRTGRGNPLPKTVVARM